MRSTFGILACFCVMSVSQAGTAPPDESTPTAPVTDSAMSSTTPQPVSAQSSNHASEAPAASPNSTMPAATSATPAAAASVAANQLPTAEEKRLKAQGYKIEMRGDGQKVFCRKETPLGTRFERKTCMTADEIHRRTENDQEAVRLGQMAHQRANPPGN